MQVITTANSFHGRTLGGIAATGQDKIKAGFHPMVGGFPTHVPFNDAAAMAAAITPTTAAVMVEGIQGEGGILPADAEYLLQLRKLCDDHGILLLFDAVQCGLSPPRSPPTAVGSAAWQWGERNGKRSEGGLCGWCVTTVQRISSAQHVALRTIHIHRSLPQRSLSVVRTHPRRRARWRGVPP